MYRTVAMRRASRAACALALAGLVAVLGASPAAAVSSVTDQHGVVWDVNDAKDIATDDGSVLSGGDYNPFGSQTTTSPFDGYGSLRAIVSTPAGPVGGAHVLRGFGLTFDGTDDWATTTPLTLGGVSVRRSIHADTSGWLRYADTFTNTSPGARRITVSFGGSLGYTGPGYPRLMSTAGTTSPYVRYVAATSSGDTRLTTRDSWVALADSHDGTASGPSLHGPAGVLFSGGAGQGPRGFSDYEYAAGAFRTPYGTTPRSRDFLGVDDTLEIPPGRTATLVHFLAAGTGETTKDAGQQVAAVESTLKRLAAAPPLADLPLAERCTLRNFDPRAVAGYSATACAKLPRATTSAVRPAPKPTTSSPYPVADRTVSQMVADLDAGRTTSVALTQAYLDRIAAFDPGSTGLHSYLYLDPRYALAQAREADRKRAKGVRLPLLGVPIGLKDLYDTKDMPTTGGSLALAGSRPERDATSVARLRAAGAVILGKLNLSEFAWSGSYSQSGVGGSTYNPYDIDRSPAGSSGGSGASTAASLNGFSMGTDSCGSLQGVAGVNGVDTYRATRGLTSAAGVYPLDFWQDSAGPITRSVRDLALTLNVLAGSDPADPVTAHADEHIPKGGYLPFLRKDALKGARLGYLNYFPGQYGDPAQERHFQQVLAQLRAAGATVVDVTAGFNAASAGPESAYQGSGVWGTSDYHDDVDTFLAGTPGYTKPDLAGIASSGKAMWWLQSFLDDAVTAPVPTAQQRAATASDKEQLNSAIEQFMGAQHVDALVYPTQSDDPPLADGMRGFNQNCQISADSGLPGVVVNAGLDSHRLPVGLEFLGRDWSDGTLLGLAYAFEQSAAGTPLQRVAPAGYGNLPYRPAR